MTLTTDLRAQESDVRVLEAFLDSHPEVKVVNVRWIDLCGVARSRTLPVPTFSSLIQSKGGLSGSCVDMTLPVDQAILPELLGGFFTHTQKIVPDLTSLRTAFHDSARLGNTAVVSSDVVGSRDWDPRIVLARALDKAEKDLGLQFLVGFELEFCFIELDKATSPAAVQKGMFGASITTRSQYWPILNQITVALSEAGINIEQLHKEYGNSQFEIALPPSSPIQSADMCLYARETIKDIAYQHGLMATFYPDPFTGDEGLKTGQHIHISANPTRDPASFDTETFLGGLLSHIPALCALGMACVDSYSRSHEGHIGTGGFVAWGTNNRDVPVRLVTKNHWEVRCNDTTSNPYLMLLGIISAGLDKQPLTMKEITKFPPMMSPEEKEACGYTTPLPSSLREGLDALKKDENWAKSFMGTDLYEMYSMLKNYEWENESKKDEKVRKLAALDHF